MKIRLEKFLSSQQIGTRTQVKQIIKSNNVTIDGNIEKNYAKKINPLLNQIAIKNKIIEYKKFIYIALNKPKNYVCANKDNLNSTILELVSGINYNLHIVGRLDKDTTGLILLTNDGKWSHKMKSPKTNTEKEYEVLLKNPLTNLTIQKIRSQIILDNKILKPVKITKSGDKTCNIILTEGKYHQIKRIFLMFDNQVVELNRIRIGKYNLNDLNIMQGKWKEINQ